MVAIKAMLAKDEKHFPRKLLRHIYLEEKQRSLKWAKQQPGFPGQIGAYFEYYA